MRKLFTFLLLQPASFLTVFFILLCCFNPTKIIAQGTGANTKCYADKDHDGFGDPNDYILIDPTLLNCSVYGRADNGLDCDDNNAAINPNTVWYKDLDNDGYTDGVTLTQCDQPFGYILNPLRDINGALIIDCNDNNKYEYPFQSWYYDPDHDGYVTGPVTIACSMGADYTPSVLVIGGDCNQNDPLEHPDQVWYPDFDKDGYPASTTTIVQCTRPVGYRAASELISTTMLDCNDADANVNPATIWYKDSDGDGYTDGATLIQCDQPSGYINNPQRNSSDGVLVLDCNDNDPVQLANQNWYTDNDGDGYGADILSGGTIVLSCSRPAGNYFAASELKGVNDCNDGDATINPETIWVLDKDHDGYYTGNPVTQCTSPGTGYVIKTNQQAGDCNDDDATINPTTQWYLDADNDGYYTSLQIGARVQCESPGPGWRNTGILGGDDCNDNDPTINPATIWYLDADNDGYYDPLYIGQPSCFPPADGRHYISTTKGADCNDGDATYNPETVWVIDKDGDGYYSGDPIIGCLVFGGPVGVVRKTTQLPGDCDDNNTAINPGTVWYTDADGDGYSDGTPQTQCTRPMGGKLASELKATSGDCNDNDAAINPGTTWLFDGDNDGYYSGEYIGVGSCTSPGPGWKPASEFTKGLDCDDNDASVTVERIWYKDADNDGYSDGTMLTQCARPTGYKLASELTAISGDCNDADATVHAPVQYYIDGDKDGYGSTATAMLCSSTAPVGYSTNNTDYDDADPTVHTVPTTTSTGVTSSLNPSCAGSNVTFTATVTSNGNPVTTGSVSFVLDANTILAAAVPLDANGQATYSVITLPAGSQTINVGYSGATGFAISSGTVNQIINSPATVGFSGLAPSYCANAGAVTLTGNPAGGTFSGPGISSDIFDPLVAGAGGPYTITYSYTNNGCSNTSSQQVSVNAVATATISGSTAVCIGAPSSNITFRGSGGTAPYTFTFTLGDAPAQTVTTSTGSSVTVAVPTNNAATLSYNLMSVQDASSTQCSQTVSGQTATVIVNGSPTGSISGSTSVCANSASPYITFGGSGGTAPYTFAYTLFDGSTTTSYSITGNPAKVTVPTGTAGNYTYTLISVQDASSTQCSQVANGQAATVTVNPTPDATITTESMVTAASSGNIASVPDAGSGAIYNWAIINGAINSGAGASSISYKAGNSGSVTINVSVTSGSSCGPVSNSTVVPTTPLPCPSPAIIAASYVCSASAGNIASVANAGTGATYVWTITNGTITSGGGTRQVTFTATANKFFDYNDYISLSVKVTNASGACTVSSGTYKIFISPIPSTVISTPSSVCSLSQGNVAWVPFAYTGATYKWTITNGTITAGSNTRSIVYTAGTSGSVTLSVVVTNTNGCSASSGNKLVTIAGLPVATITAASSVCSRSYNNTASVTSGGTGTRYAWSISNGSINSGSNASSITYSAGASGSVTLTVVVTNSSGCKTNSGNKLVTIIALPNAAITAASSTCTNSTGNAASVSSAGSGSSYSWTISGGTITSGSGTNIIKYTAGVTGYVTLGVIVTNSNGCKATYSKRISIIGLPAGNITTSSSVCGASTGNTASVSSAGTGATYAWIISNGTITSGGATSSIKYTAGSSGTVTLSITVTNSTGCKTTGNKNVTINAATVPVFTQVTALCLNSTAPTLPTKSTNGITGTWSPSKVTTSVVATTTYTFTPAAGQCASTTTMKITVKNCTALSNANIVSNEPKISKAAPVMDAVIMPNPSENFFTLIIKGNRKEVAEIRVMDVQGRWLDHFRISTGGSIQFGGNYAHGTYIVQVIQGSGQKQLKVIKL